MTARALGLRSPELDEYVRRARERLGTMLPGVSFDGHTWDTGALAKSAADRTQTAYFTVRGSETVPLLPVFADGVKAWVITSGGTASRLNQRVTAARWLWGAIAERLGSDAPTLFTWRDLRHADLHRAELMMIESGWSPRSINKTATTMSDLARALGLLRIAPAITYTPITPRQSDTNNHRVKDPESRSAGVLTVAAQHALADIFFRATTTADRFYAAQMALLLATGVRWNESVTLPLDALDEREVEVPDATGTLTRVALTYVRRHKSKSLRAGGAGRKNLEEQPLTDQQAELARMAVDRLTTLCADARTVARRLEASAPRWLWPNNARPAWLYREDIERALGVGPDQANTILRMHRRA